MRIANPIYDVVFKYLLDDEKVARLVLSALLGKEILELAFRPTEIRRHAGPGHPSARTGPTEKHGTPPAAARRPAKFCPPPPLA